jgi:hypothetical protein
VQRCFVLIQGVPDGDPGWSWQGNECFVQIESASSLALNDSFNTMGLFISFWFFSLIEQSIHQKSNCRFVNANKWFDSPCLYRKTLV